MAFMLEVNIQKPSSVILNLLFVLCFIPSATVFSLNSNHPAEGFYGLFLSFMIISLLLRIHFFSINFQIPYFRFTEFKFWLLFVFSALFLITAVYYGIALRWVSFSDVYDVRSEYMEQGNRLVGYFYGWLTHVLNIAILLIALNRKNYFLALFSIALQIYLYTLGAHKAVLLIIPFILWLYTGVKYFSGIKSLYFVSTFLIVCSALYLYDFSNGQYSDISSLVIRRNLLLPAQIYFHYVEYFGSYYIDYFSQNFPFSLFYDSNYNEKLPALIGQNYFTFKEGIYANGNIFADLYANLGVLSFTMGAVIIAFLFKILDAVAGDKNNQFVLPLAAVSVVSLSNSGLIVNLVTHGVLVMILLLALYPKTVFNLKFFKE
jgi:hypothetical protein